MSPPNEESVFTIGRCSACYGMRFRCLQRSRADSTVWQTSKYDSLEPADGLGTRWPARNDAGVSTEPLAPLRLEDSCVAGRGARRSAPHFSGFGCDPERISSIVHRVLGDLPASRSASICRSHSSTGFARGIFLVQLGFDPDRFKQTVEGIRSRS